jgi:hypothetical protein
MEDYIYVLEYSIAFLLSHGTKGEMMEDPTPSGGIVLYFCSISISYGTVLLKVK